MSAARRSVTLFYPMYNELKSIEPTTRKALQVMSSSADDFEILIIDDGSTDGSEKIADQLAAEDRHIKVIHHQGNRGYGQALRTGWANASKDIVVYTDCDEPVDLWKIPEALAHMDNYDMVVGYRLNRWEGWRRFIYSKGYNALVRLLFGVRVRDINFSFKLIGRDLLQKLRLSAGSVFIDGELLAEAARYHPKIDQMPVHYLPRKHGASHFDSIRAATYTLEEIWAYWQRRRHESKEEVSAPGAVNANAASAGYESQAKRL
jgi:glycosyltransferase involved in cell wall biosynthesis